MKLTDAQWAVVEPLLPKPPKRADGRGRPRRPDREVLDGILWVLKTGARWQDLPDRYPPHATCHRRFQEWNRTMAFVNVLKALAEDLRDRGGLDLTECSVDATFVSAKKGARASARPSEARAARSWQSQTAMVFLSPSLWRALPRMKSRWLRLRLRFGSLRRIRSAFLGTALTTAISWTSGSEPEALR